MAEVKVPFRFRAIGPPDQDKVDADFEHLENFINDTLIGSISTPAQITGDQNNYDPGTAEWLRLDTDATRTITGFVAGESGDHLWVINIGSNDLKLANQSGSSTAANRVITGHGVDITLDPDASAHLWYDSATSRWRILGTNPSIWS